MWFSKQGVVLLNALPSEERSREFRVNDEVNITIETDSTGRKFIHQVIAESTKNHGIDDTPDDTTGEGKIYKQPGSTFCPVRCFEKYLSKLNPKLEA
ncbi:hypothetical protein DPMN_161315 [Dreissena polymorpha]|uniref:Uncharacterized protein n=1 Tax=Dreissena polymorpha TaxID=45954 RepID=A0A9D4ITB8_DREPO|nr:hypothetical protein DPMN_161315 [Dreissena polymorpha]